MVPTATRETFESGSLTDIILSGATLSIGRPSPQRSQEEEEDGRAIVRSQIADLRNALPGIDVCRFCGCTPASPCRMADGDHCSWISQGRTACTAPSCVRAFYQHASVVGRPLRMAGR